MTSIRFHVGYNNLLPALCQHLASQLSALWNQFETEVHSQTNIFGIPLRATNRRNPLRNSLELGSATTSGAPHALQSMWTTWSMFSSFHRLLWHSSGTCNPGLYCRVPLTLSLCLKEVPGMLEFWKACYSTSYEPYSILSMAILTADLHFAIQDFCQC